MTVTISKPAINIREKLTEASAVVPYEQRQFHFDNLVTNGTFDADISGWTDSSMGTGSIAYSSGTMLLNSNGNTNLGITDQSMTVVVGQRYKCQVEITATTGALNSFKLGSSQNGAQYGSVVNIGVGIHTFEFVPTNTTLWFRFNGYFGVGTTNIDNVSVYPSDGTDIAFTMPKGWKPLHVYDDGVLQREGSAEDYEVTFDGFHYYVKPTVANPGARNTVIGVRA